MVKKKPVIIFAIILICSIIFFLVRKKEKEVPLNISIVCTRLPKVKIRDRTPQAIGNYIRKWPSNRVLKVYFSGPRTSLINDVLSIANVWQQHCGMSFVYCPTPALAQIRVTFKMGGYASAIGRECEEREYCNKYTMFLEGLDTLKDRRKFRTVVLHEFGHALGLEHELSHPNANIPWDKEEVYKFYKKKFKWSRPEVDQQIFRVLEPGIKPYDDFDSTSIMVYAVAPPLTIKPYKIDWPNGLSSSDIRFIAKWYPRNLN